MNKVSCSVCEQRCALSPGETGICGIRKNMGGIIKNPDYGKLISVSTDPIEKKPLYHFFPGEKTLSIASAGCNFSCKFCQNYQISQKEFHKNLSFEKISPENISRILEYKNLNILTFTYSEPTVWIDYLLDCAKISKQKNKKNAMVTNGYFTEETMEKLLPLIDAYNIDYKGEESFYSKLCGAHEHPVIRNISRINRESKAVLEVTTLVIEKYHSIEKLLSMAEKLFEAGVKVWHLSRFFPAYKMTDCLPTSEKFIKQAVEKISEKFPIPYIYAGNCAPSFSSNTKCSSCKETLIERNGFYSHAKNLKKGICPSCSGKIYGQFKN